MDARKTMTSLESDKALFQPMRCSSQGQESAPLARWPSQGQKGAGWSKWPTRQAHDLKTAGSNPAPA